MGRKVRNDSNWLQIAPNGSKWLQMAPKAPTGSNWLQMAPNGSTLLFKLIRQINSKKSIVTTGLRTKLDYLLSLKFCLPKTA